jgi:pimeloyl-ACP methyl ester carboxylesterase
MKIDVGGVPIVFESSGEGPTLLLLHAFPLSAAMWAQTAVRLGPRCRVVAVDARGFGGSGAAPGALTMDRIADDAAAVLDHLGVGTAIAAGCSMGGYAALAFARRFASRLSGLVLVDTRAAADTDEARAGRTALAQKVEAQGAPAIVEAMLPKILGSTSHRERLDVVDRVRGWMLAAPPAAIVSALQGMAARADSRPLLGEIRVPCLILRGEEDAITSAADVNEMQLGIPRSRAVTIPRAGHLSSVEAPEDFAAAIIDFLPACTH